MNDKLVFQKATRQGVKPIVGLYAESGCGKTYSALLLARGIAGPSGRIAMVDTESGRGQIYADVIPGGYDCLELSAPFSPGNYIATIHAAEEAKYDVLIVDSASHEWEGIGGVLDMAGEKEEAGGKGLSIWKEPKMAHAKFLLTLLQSPLIVIVCLRAKFKSRQVRNKKGKTEIVKDDHVTPIQAEDFIFEMTAHAEILPDHSIHLTKCSHPELRKCFPEHGPIAIQHGELIAKWASGTGEIQATSTPDDAAKKARVDLWMDAKSRFKTGGELEQYLKDGGMLELTETLKAIDTKRIIEIHALLRKEWSK